eukprot:gene42430-57444_t
MSAMTAVADWTTGVEAISYQCCPSCNELQYFRRAFCAAGGAER